MQNITLKISVPHSQCLIIGVWQNISKRRQYIQILLYGSPALFGPCREKGTRLDEPLEEHSFQFWNPSTIRTSGSVGPLQIARTMPDSVQSAGFTEHPLRWYKWFQIVPLEWCSVHWCSCQILPPKWLPWISMLVSQYQEIPFIGLTEE